MSPFSHRLPVSNTTSKMAVAAAGWGWGVTPNQKAQRLGGDVPEGVGRRGQNSRDKNPLWRQPAGLFALHLGSTKNTFCVFLLFLSLGLFQGGGKL